LTLVQHRKPCLPAGAKKDGLVIAVAYVAEDAGLFCALGILVALLERDQSMVLASLSPKRIPWIGDSASSVNDKQENQSSASWHMPDTNYAEH